MIGKWHLGYHKWEYTPTYRGFDTFYGFYNGWGDHYSHEIDKILDLRDNKEAVRDLNGTFATFAFSKVIIAVRVNSDNCLLCIDQGNRMSLNWILATLERADRRIHWRIMSRERQRQNFK